MVDDRVEGSPAMRREMDFYERRFLSDLDGK
jgi:hypothetical protein